MEKVNLSEKFGRFSDHWSPKVIADQSIHLDAGEMIVVPKGVRHRPHAEEECLVMLVEPKDVINTGAERSDLQAANDVWI